MGKKNDGDKGVRNSINDFLPAYLQAARDGVTLEDFAASMNVKPLTVYQRVTKLRADGVDIPSLEGTSVGRVSVADRARQILEQFNAENG